MRMDRAHHFLVGMGPGNRQHLRVMLEDLVGLRTQAPRYDDLPVAFQGLANRGQRLGHRLVDESARIDHDQLRALVVRRDLVSFALQLAEDALGIDERLGAPQADKSHLAHR